MDQSAAAHSKCRHRNETGAKGRARLLASTIVACILCMAIAGMAGCSAQQGTQDQGQAEGQRGAQTSDSATEQSAPEQITIMQSPDKYTWYVKNYAGSNLANVGYVSMSNDLRDRYGASNVKLVPVSTDGSYVDVTDEEALKGYVVVSQNLKPNTEIKLIFDVDENGEEYDNLVRCSSIDSIVLLVKPVGGSDTPTFDIPLTQIDACPGPETRYVQDYVGRNLASAGYISMAGDLRDHYGEGNVKLVPVADDGSFIDTNDIEALKSYRVVSQNVAPNTAIAFTLDSEYTGLVDSQSLEEIELRVTKVEQ